MKTLQQWIEEQRHILKHDPDVDGEHHGKALRIIEAIQEAGYLNEEIAEEIINEK